MFQSGKGVNKRRAHNYIGRQAHARLQEIVAPAKERELNALLVDSFEVLYFRRSNSSLACTCQKKTAPPVTDYSEPMSQGDAFAARPVLMAGDEEISIDLGTTMFGTTQTADYTAEDETLPEFGVEDDELLIGDEDEQSADKTFAMSTDCGICYRNGMVPGYELYGHDRKVLVAGMVNDIAGYVIDQSLNPDQFIKIDPSDDSYVEFVVEVPKYFKSVRFSVRNGIKPTDDMLWLPTDRPQILTAAAVRANAGSSLAIRVRATSFTHVVVQFDLGVQPVLAALAQDNKATDWTKFDTLGNVSFILPNTIQSVETSDVVYVPKRNHTFKISDVTYLRTANNHNMDWQVQGRVLQPQEGLKLIYKSHPLL